MSYIVPTKGLSLGDDPVYIDLDCKTEVQPWGEAMVKEYGPIEEQGCDRCESGRANWVRVRVAL